jgi:hypothetical protein
VEGEAGNFSAMPPGGADLRMRLSSRRLKCGPALSLTSKAMLTMKHGLHSESFCAREKFRQIVANLNLKAVAAKELKERKGVRKSALLHSGIRCIRSISF